MKTPLRRLLAAALCLLLLTGAALALTPEELGDLLRERYVDEVPAAVWAEDTVIGMLTALNDPYVHWLTPEGVKKVMAETVEEDEAAPTVTFELDKERGIGMMTLSGFTAQTADLAEEAVAGHDGLADRWILDLRGNRGGELSNAVNTLAVFTGGGTLGYLRDKTGKLAGASSERHSASMDPVVVLVDSKTASAAELFVAGIRDRRAGVLIGSRTFGKGVAQSLLTQATDPDLFPDGDGLLLTTHRFFSAGFNSNNTLGVIPHLMVSDDLAPRVAKVLCGPSPAGDTAGLVRLHLGGWRWYLDRTDAKTDPAAFTALLEALPPQAELFLGTGGVEGWQPIAAAALAEAEGLTVTPRVFSDVAGSPYAAAINALKTYGVVDGDELGRYNPNKTMNRAEMCALLVKAMKYPISEAASPFSDVPDGQWYTPYIVTLSSLGLVNGRGDGTFDPGGTVPHQEFMVLMSRIAAYTNHLAYANAAEGPTSEDLAAGGYAAAGYAGWAAPGVWLLDGCRHDAAKNIKPLAPETREEAAYDLWSALSAIGILPD